MDHLFYLFFQFTLLCGMGLIALGVAARQNRGLQERIRAVVQGIEPTIKEERPPAEELKGKIIALASWLRGRLGMTDSPQLKERFMRAGLASEYQDFYTTARILGPVMAIVGGMLAPSNRFFWITAMGGITYLLPDMWLQRMIKGRQKRIQLGIPDAVDLLVICVDAGLGLDQAMLRVGHELGASHPDIQSELLHLNREQRAGKVRLQAWQDLAQRNKLPELDAFVNMLMQTERFGTPIARALSQFGDGLRQKRRQKAEELAAKTTIKIIFPLVFFIFPSMFVVLLGPAGITMMRSMTN